MIEPTGAAKNSNPGQLWDGFAFDSEKPKKLALATGDPMEAISTKGPTTLNEPWVEWVPESNSWNRKGRFPVGAPTRKKLC